MSTLTGATDAATVSTSNSLQDKGEYLKQVMKGRHSTPDKNKFALELWSCAVSVDTAKRYLDMYEESKENDKTLVGSL